MIRQAKIALKRQFSKIMTKHSVAGLQSTWVDIIYFLLGMTIFLVHVAVDSQSVTNKTH